MPHGRSRSAQLLPIFTLSVPLWLIILGFVLGAALLLPAVTGFIKHKTTVSPLSPGNATTLVTDGVFGITRNPMYVGMLLLLLAFVSWLGTLSGLVMVVAFFLLIDRAQIPAEERSLLANFGSAYRDYAERVPRWLFVRKDVT